MDEKELVQIINMQLQTAMPENISPEDLVIRIAEYINYLINNNFQKLLILLYRVDISEMKLKKMLQINSNEDAATLIANLLIEREREKKMSRNKYSNRREIDEEEKW